MDQVAEKSVAAIAPQRKASLLEVMAMKYHMDPQTFAATVRKTAMPSNATNEEFAAFMMVAKEYNLNPILKEIHAFPKKGGGIQPIVSIDGWISLVNQHSQCDGYEFEWTTAANGDPISCKCTMYRKDRKHPVVVEEFLAECIRSTEPWKMKHRMLRHKALMQAARYAFGFSGIMDQDEAETIAQMRDITPATARPQMSDFAAGKDAAPTAEATGSAASTAEKVDEQTGEITEVGVPDALELGRVARRENRPRRPTDGLTEAEADAWRSGWDEVDEERQQAAKK
jgi:phage recombination protein Bet